MQRKLFISFLGTNNYVQTYYQIKEHKSNPVRFIQEALLDMPDIEWSESDKIIIFYTKDSYNANWLDNGQQRAEDAIEKIGLNSILSKKPYKDIVEGVEIKEGFSEEDIWDIFNVVYNKIEENDEIYFDVTHAFRSIPMFSTILFNFAKFLKGAELKKVYYGAFEKLGPAFKVKSLPLEERVAPIIDLSNIIRLQELTGAADALVNYGKIKGVRGSILPSVKKDPMKSIIDQLRNGVAKMESHIITNRQSELMDISFIGKIKSQIEDLIKAPTTGLPEKEVLKKLSDKLAMFSENDSEANIKASIYWAIEYDMIPQAYTLGQEYILSLLYNKYKDRNFYNEENPKQNVIKFRTFLSNVLGINDQKIESGDYQIDNKPLAEELWQEKTIMNLRKGCYKAIADHRNILNHAKPSDLTVEQFKMIFSKEFPNCLNAFE
ncbi:MAG: TIGR02221 family CRISPR-associated protein [Paludibacteraceae bacterium]|nr:TIGR02221 family CRISPR-associated protein [Paludibacteraceae bacterium]